MDNEVKIVKQFLEDYRSICNHDTCTDCPLYNIDCDLKNTDEIEDIFDVIKMQKYNVKWDKIAKDTPLIVHYGDINEDRKAYFAYFRNNLVYVWSNGRTSFTAKDDSDVVSCKSAFLYRLDK